MAPKVYFTDFCTGTSETLPQKLARLILSAGIDQIDFQNKFVAIKIHFGELGNMAHLRPGYARVLVDIIKDLGHLPEPFQGPRGSRLWRRAEESGYGLRLRRRKAGYARCLPAGGGS